MSNQISIKILRNKQQQQKLVANLILNWCVCVCGGRLAPYSHLETQASSRMWLDSTSKLVEFPFSFGWKEKKVTPENSLWGRPRGDAPYCVTRSLARTQAHDHICLQGRLGNSVLLCKKNRMQTVVSSRNVCFTH